MENLPKTASDFSVPKDHFKKNIKRWYEKRNDKSILESYLTEVGNRFTFKPDRSISAYLHIYLAINNEDELSFYVIEENDDKHKKNNWLSASVISSHKEPLPSKLIESNKDYLAKLPYKEVVKWVDNWNDEKIRGQWIDDNFNSKLENNTIMLAFRINSADFSEGVRHECFLALKKIKSKYVADIVVYNTDSLKIVNTSKAINAEDSTYEDLARPVPPFGGDYDDYGVLVELDIK